MIAFFTRNGVAANLLMFAIIFAGVFALFSRKIPLEVFPEHESRSISISVAYRGATPEEVEETVVIRVEEAISDVEGIEEVGLPAWCTGLNPNSPYSKGPGAVGDGAMIGGQYVCSGDIIVADRSGVVVIPHAKIDATIKALEDVKAAESAFEAKVKGGETSFFDLDAMVAEGKAVWID